MGHMATVKHLLKHANCDVNVVDGEGNTPLHLASYHFRMEVVEVLIEYGASVNAVNNLGFTPLLWLSSSPKNNKKKITEMISLFLENGANFRLTTMKGETALHLAASKGNVEVIQALISSSSALINSVDLEGNTPLHKACLAAQDTIVSITNERGLKETMALLIHMNALHSIRNSKGETPLELCETSDMKATLINLIKNHEKNSITESKSPSRKSPSRVHSSFPVSRSLNK